MTEQTETQTMEGFNEGSFMHPLQLYAYEESLNQATMQG